MNIKKINYSIERFFNRGQFTGNRAFNDETKMEYSFVWFIVFANMGAVILVAFVHVMNLVDASTTGGVVGMVFKSPLAFLLTSSIAVAFGNMSLLLASIVFSRRKAKQISSTTVVKQVSDDAPQ